MKKLIPLLIMFLSVIGLKAQENDISLSVLVPPTAEGLNPGQLSKIETKIQKMLTQKGISGEGYFIIFPKYEIYDHTVAEGMQNLHVLDVGFNLIVQEIQTGKIYGTYSQEIQSQGSSMKKAVDGSISQIKTQGEKIDSFLTETTDKIMDHYTTHCDQIEHEADNLIAQGRFREAIALLYAVPKGTGAHCYSKIQDKLNEAYLGYMNETCEDNIVKARNAIEHNKKETALEVLGDIDPNSNCYSEAQKLRVKAEVNGGIGKDTEASASVEGSYARDSKTVTADKDGNEKVVKKRSKKIKVIAEAQYRSRHEKFMAENS